MVIVLTGGGTGGHVIPALALLPELKTRFNRIVYIGGNGIEKKLAEAEGLEYYETASIGFNRSKLLKNFKIPFVLLKGISQAKKILKEVKPDVIFSKGGYVSLPTVIASRILHIPIVAHESDFSLGLANRIAYLLNAIILTSFPQTAEINSKFIYAGFPLRKKMFKGNGLQVKNSLNITSSKPVILIVGGSTGSQAINTAVLEALPTLVKNYTVIHLTGKGKKINYSNPNYFTLEYATNIEDFYNLADIVISRAGAGAVSELSMLCKHTVLIPLPKGNSRGDQIQNAKFASEYGATILLQEDLSCTALIDAVQRAKDNAMRPLSPVANYYIANILFGIAVKNRKIISKKATK